MSDLTPEQIRQRAVCQWSGGGAMNMRAIRVSLPVFITVITGTGLRLPGHCSKIHEIHERAQTYWPKHEALVLDYLVA